MPNTVDEMIIALGLDSSKFDKAQKSVVDKLRSMEDIQRRGTEKDQQRMRQTVEGYKNLGASVIEFGTALLGLNGIKDIVASTVGSETSLYRTGFLLDMHTRKLNAYGMAARQFGGSQDATLGTFESLQKNLSSAMAGNNPEFFKNMRLLGLQPGDLKSMTAMSAGIARETKSSKYLQTIGKPGIVNLLGSMGVDQGTALLLLQGPDKVRALVQQAYRLSDATQKNVQATQRLYGKWIKLEETVTGVKQRLVGDIVPGLDAAVDATTKLVHLFATLDKGTHGALGTAAMAGGAAGAVGLGGMALKALGGGGVGLGFLPQLLLLAGTGAAAYKGGSLLASHLPDGFMQGLGSVEAHFLSYYGDSTARRAVQGKSGLPVGLRENNPGNITYGPFAKSHGATGKDAQGFALFPSMASGKAAMSALLQTYRANGLKTTGGIIGRYAPSSSNNTGAYIADVDQRMHVGPNQVLSQAQYGPLQKAMMIHEQGAKYAALLGSHLAVASGSKTHVETHIHEINVNAPHATDAHGVASGMRSALSRNNLIGAYTLGLI